MRADTLEGVVTTKKVNIIQILWHNEDFISNISISSQGRIGPSKYLFIFVHSLRFFALFF